MQKNSIIFITLLLTLATQTSQKINKNLLKKVIYLNDLQRTNNQNNSKNVRSQDATVVKSKVSLFNTLFTNLRNNQQSEKPNSSYLPFKIKGVDFDDGTTPHEYYAMFHYFCDYDDSRECTRNQEKMSLIISKYEDVQAIDQDHFFFPHYYGTYLTKSVFDFYTDKVETFDKYETMDRLDEKAFVVTDSYDMTLDHYMDQVYSNKLDSLFTTRLRIFTNLGQTLIKIETKYTFCYLNPTSILFSKISAEESQLLDGNGIYPLQLTPNQFYQLRMGDLDFMAGGKPKDRKCLNGVMGYLPMEIEDPQTPHDKFDIFSVAIMMIDTELQAIGYKGFQFSIKMAQMLIKKKKTEAKQNVSIQYGNRQELWRRKFFDFAKVIFDDEELVLKFWEALGKYSTSVLGKGDKPIQFSGKTKPQLHEFNSLWENNVVMLIPIAYAMCDVFFNSQYKSSVLTQITQSDQMLHDQYAQQLNNLKTDSEQYKITEELQNYYSQRIQLKNNEADKKIELINYLLSVAVSNYESRPNL